MLFEMLNVLIALRVGPNLSKNKKVLIWCDNRWMVDVIANNKTGDGELGASYTVISIL